MKLSRLVFIIILLLTVAVPSNARALSSSWEQDGTAAMRIVSGVDGVGDEKAILLGLEIQLAPDWHTYWRSPGEAGLPPQFDWKNSLNDTGNLQTATILYPAPKRSMTFGIETIGYNEHVLLPIYAQLRMPGKPLSLDITADILVCSDICVPKHFVLKLVIPKGPAVESAEASLIRKYRNLVPIDDDTAGMHVKNITLSSDAQSLTIDVTSKDEFTAPDIFIETEKNIAFYPPVMSLGADKHNAEFNVKLAGQQVLEGNGLINLPLTITITDGDHAAEQKEIVPPPSKVLPPPLPSLPTLPLGIVILFAIIGGFILNLMPCVLPVLSLKILSVASHGGGEAKTVRHSFLTTAAGILFSFLVLAGVTIVMKETGLTIGWGVQFQQPIFLLCLVILLTFFAANLLGLFEIKLPQLLADTLSDTAYHPKLAGDFATGAFATLLATPCTAPFLGTAVGFALASGPRNILIIFCALGFGMILPYLAIALWPGMATALPKPGRWMVILRHLLGWALALTAAWLIWVLAAQLSPRVAIVIALCMTGVIGLLGLQKINPQRRFLNYAIGVFILSAFCLTILEPYAPEAPAEVDTSWQAFDETAISQDVMDGKTVFVDVTADWCLTCKANKRFILSQDDVKQRLFHTDIVAMQADWTNPNPTIAAFLQKYRRYGIPFNAVFGPGAPQGIVLPELLTHHAVLEALDKAAKPAKH